MKGRDVQRSEYREWVLRELDGSLDAERQAELERALGADPALAEFAARQRRLDGLLEGLAEPPADPAATARALAAIRARVAAGASARRPLPFWTAPRVAAAAALALVAGALVALIGERSAPRESAVERVASTAGTVGRGAPRGAAAEREAVDGDRSSGVDPRGSAAPGAGADAVAPAGIEATGGPAAALGAGAALGPGASLVARLAALGATAAPLDRVALAAVAPEPAEPWAERRAVERILDGTPTLAVARGALRFLGARGDRLSARAIEEQLHDPALRADALDALVALGPDGWSGLAAALLDDELCAAALEAWRGVTDGGAARSLGDACERLAVRPRRGDDLARAVGALADLGADGVAELLERVERGEVGLDVARAALAPRHAAGLVRVLDGRPTTAATIAFARAARADALAPRLAEAATDPTLGPDALAALAALPGVDAGVALLELRRVGRPSLEAVDDALAARDDAEGWQRLATRVAGDRELAAVLVEFLLGDPALDASAALATLARSDLLPSDLRLLALGACDADDELTRGALAALLADCAPRDARLGAAALVALARGGGVEHALRLVPARPALERELRAALDRDPTSGLVRLARELRPILPLKSTDGDELP